MVHVIQKIGTGVAAAFFATFLFAGVALADSTVDVVGNGAFSENDVQLQTNSDVNVQQDNTTDVRTAVANSANTGGIVASFNTGGDLDVQTGDATSYTTVDVESGNNILGLCGACGGSTDVLVGGNGAFSLNDVEVDTDSDVDVRQQTRTQVQSDIVTASNTGGVVGSFNTGSDIDVETGDATARTEVDVTGGGNFASVDGCGCGDSDLDVAVLGNGAFSESDVDVDTSNDVDVAQDSDTRVETNVENELNTGFALSTGGGRGHDFDLGHKFGSLDKFGDHGRKDWDHNGAKNSDKKEHDAFWNNSSDWDFRRGGDKLFSRKDHDDKLRLWKFLKDRHFGGNTGGDINIRTGDVDSETRVEVSGGSNVITT